MHLAVKPDLVYDARVVSDRISGRDLGERHTSEARFT